MNDCFINEDIIMKMLGVVLKAIMFSISLLYFIALLYLATYFNILLYWVRKHKEGN